MALDTKQKQGSAIHISLPWRQWLAEPAATIDEGEKISLLRFCSDVLPEEAVAETGHVYELTGSLSTFALEGTL